MAGIASTSESPPLCHEAGAAAPTIPGTVRTLAAIGVGVAAVLDEHDERLHRARADVGVGEHLPARDRGSRAREVLELRLVRVHLQAVGDEHAHDCQAAERDRPGMAQHEPRPAAPGAVLGVAVVDEPLRHHPQAVDPRAERCQQRRQQRDRRDHRDERDQHPADAHRADERQRDHDQGEQTDGHRRPGHDHGAAGMRHRLHERGLDLCALAQLVAEAEDHQQRVVDRDAQPDERDQELDDDRDVRDVGQDPDQRERVQDRRHRDHERHQHRRQRAEHEEEDHERAERADHRLEQHARAAAVSVRARFLERVVARHLDGRAGREPGCGGGPHAVGAARGVELRDPGRVDLLEDRVPVGRDVHRVAGREVRARPCARHRRGGALHRTLDRDALGRVAARVEDDDIRRPHAGAEPLQRALVRLVGGLTGDREALVPALRDLARRDRRRRGSARSRRRSRASGAA